MSIRRKLWVPQKKRPRRGLLLPVLALALASFSVLEAGAAGVAGNATATTYALRQEGGEACLTPTQDAYLTGDVLFLEDPLRMPEDLYYRDSRLYVADTGNGRIVCRDLSTGERNTVGEGILATPRGVFVTGQGEIYVADDTLGAVVVFNEAGTELRRYGRPGGIAFGADAQYQPVKVAVSDAGILYIVSSGSFDGMIQLDASGEFLGYYGYNNVPVTALELVQDFLFTDAQKERLFHKIPLAFSNLAMDGKGLCYTVTQRTEAAPLKKHNIAGVNILQGTIPAADLADLSIGPEGQIFAVSESGLIYELDNDGELLFTLGGQAANSERRGLFTLASGIAADENCTLYVLDKERGIVHTFLPAEYALLMHEAISLYRSGRYQESEATLNQILKLAGNLQMVYRYLGKVQMQLGNYKAAQESYRRGGEAPGYSDAFWEVRTGYIGKGVRFALPVLLGAALLKILWKRSGKKKKSAGIVLMDGRTAEERGFLENLKFAFHFFRAPADSFFEVKIGARGTVGTGICLYLLGFLAFGFYYAGRGFSFSTINLSNTSPAWLAVLFFVPVGLFVLSSYMVSEVNNGEGTLKRMFVGMSYGLIPMICILPVLTLLTHVLTRSESFLVNCGLAAAVGWTLLLELSAIREIHNYEPGQVAVNVVLTLFLMIVLIFAAAIMFMLWDTVLDMGSTLFKEVGYRVFR